MLSLKQLRTSDIYYWINISPIPIKSKLEDKSINVAVILALRLGKRRSISLTICMGTSISAYKYKAKLLEILSKRGGETPRKLSHRLNGDLPFSSPTHRSVSTDSVPLSGMDHKNDVAIFATPYIQLIHESQSCGLPKSST